MFSHLISEFSTFAQVILVDIVLAGDNAIVVALAAAGVPVRHRAKVILLGIGMAVVLRIVFAVAATHMLEVPGLMLFGGLLLLWVTWKLFDEVRPSHIARTLHLPCVEDEFIRVGHLPLPIGPAAHGHNPRYENGHAVQPKTLGQAIWQVTLADVSMSLDNVLAVAAAARDHTTALVFGLLLSVVLMGLMASVIARWLERYRWLGYVGVATIFYLSIIMIYDGAWDVFA